MHATNKAMYSMLCSFFCPHARHVFQPTWQQAAVLLLQFSHAKCRPACFSSFPACLTKVHATHSHHEIPVSRQVSQSPGVQPGRHSLFLASCLSQPRCPPFFCFAAAVVFAFATLLTPVARHFSKLPSSAPCSVPATHAFSQVRMQCLGQPRPPHVSHFSFSFLSHFPSSVMFYHIYRDRGAKELYSFLLFLFPLLS